MTINGQLAENLVEIFSSNSSFTDLTFVMAYENEIKPTPVSKPIVAISVKGCKIGEKLTETLDTGEITETKKREMLSTISVDIYLPYSMGGCEGHKIFDRIATFLIFTSQMKITTASCGEADYDKSCEAIVLKTQFVFRNIIVA